VDHLGDAASHEGQAWRSGLAAKGSRACPIDALVRPAVRTSHRLELTKKTLQWQSRRLCLAAAISLGYRRRHMGDKEHAGSRDLA
jgi:hypothetical protein